ncbi:Ubiquinone biosynthesis protein coq9, mitochondrial [Cladochytrium tenue]|nr:Ubiquinone biosynthesis protein coq9, mitochondrial [Cladochytrium tenue]
MAAIRACALMATPMRAATARALPSATYVARAAGFTSSSGALPPRYTVRLDDSWRGKDSTADPDSTDIEAKLLSAAMAFVPLHGWTLEALGEGAKTLGLSTAARGAFSRGPVELVEYFIRHTTAEVRKEMDALDKSRLAAHNPSELLQGDMAQSMGTTAQVRTGVLMRLERLKPYATKWPEAVALMALPQNAPYALSNLHEAADEIWYAAGDRSFDMNWYSKRMLLAGVVSSTELYMSQDRSPDFSGTTRFLDRRLQDVAFVGRSMAELSNLATFGLRSAQGLLHSVMVLLIKAS